MKTPLVIVLVIVVGMLGFLTVYSQQQAPVAQVTQGQASGGDAAPAPGGPGK
jgi:heme A synthase